VPIPLPNEPLPPKPDDDGTNSAIPQQGRGQLDSDSNESFDEADALFGKRTDVPETPPLNPTPDSEASALADPEGSEGLFEPPIDPAPVVRAATTNLDESAPEASSRIGDDEEELPDSIARVTQDADSVIAPNNIVVPSNLAPDSGDDEEEEVPRSGALVGNDEGIAGTTAGDCQDPDAHRRYRHSYNKTSPDGHHHLPYCRPLDGSANTRSTLR